jgi:predicted dehydrogenase
MINNHSVRKLLICSQGSIGRKYTSLILDYWPEIQIGINSSKSIYDLFEKEKINFAHSSFDECIKWKPDAVIISNPANYHIDYAIECMKKNIPVLVEKPVGIGNEHENKKRKILDLSEHCVALVGYVLRYEESYEIIKNILFKENLGKLECCRFICSSWLPDWRKGIDYRKTVSARKELGGGVLLELSHELDLALSLLGNINLNKTILSKSGKLDIDVEDIAFMTGESKNCKEIKFELDFCSKKPIRIVTIEGSLGRILWDLNKRKLKLKFF